MWSWLEWAVIMLLITSSLLVTATMAALIMIRLTNRKRKHIKSQTSEKK